MNLTLTMTLTIILTLALTLTLALNLALALTLTLTRHIDELTDLCVRTAENPGDAGVRQLHPLTKNIMEADKANGGLGMVKILLSEP